MANSQLALYVPDLRGGGAERVMVNLANEFSRRDVTVDLVLNRAEGAYLSDLASGVNLVDLDAPKYPIYNAMGAARPLAKYLNKHDPEVLLSGLTRTNVVSIIASTVARVETRIVVGEHNHLSSITSRSEDRSLRVLPPLVRLFYPLADGIIAVSEGVKHDLATYWPIRENDIRQIYNPIVTDELLERSKKKPDHQWLSPDTDFSVVLAAGRLNEQKDYPTLLKAIHHLQKSRDVRLIVLSEGEKLSELTAMTEHLGIDEIVDFAGFVDNPFAYMSKADVFALSSAWEGFGNVLVEAMACGTPVVSTDCESGPAEILENGKYGRLVSVGDPVAFADALDKTLSNPINKEELFERSGDFRTDKIAQEYLDYLLPGGFDE